MKRGSEREAGMRDSGLLDGILYCECGAPMLHLNGYYVCAASQPVDHVALQGELDRVFPPKRFSPRPELSPDTRAVLVQAYWVDVEGGESGWNVYVEEAFESVDDAFACCHAIGQRPFALTPRFLVEVSGLSDWPVHAIAQVGAEGVAYETVFESLREVESAQTILDLLDERVDH